MSLLCKVCDRSVIENQCDYMKYLASMRKNMKVYIINIILIMLN